ncbi:MAG: ABC transporter substrate-binding protein [Myxococcaceae bacterium]|nr:ABC transporter substrate-binding protein [Myxococcaceae bacterium]
MTRLRWSPVVVAVAFALSCSRCDGPKDAVDAGPFDAGPLALVEQEPNDGPDTALVVAGTSVVEATLGADAQKPDEDWYALTSAVPRTVDLVVTTPVGGDVALEVMDATRAALSVVNAQGPGGAERHPNLDVSGRVLVRVTTVKKGVGGAYTLSATFRERRPGFELEPNERRVDATPVQLGQAVSGLLAHPLDVDLYRFELPAPPTDAAGPGDADAGDDAGAPPAAGDDAGAPPDAGATAPGAAEARLALRVDVSALPGVALEVQVLTEAEAQLFQARSRESSGLSLRNVGVRQADRVLYVAVRSAPLSAGKDARRGASVERSYTLTVVPEEAGASAEYEPNDEAGKATDLPPNSYREGFVNPRGDVDHYALTTDGPSIVKVAVTGVDHVDLELSVVRPVEGKPDEVLLKVNEGTAREPEQLNNVRCDGVCVFRVEAVARKVDGKWVREDENPDQAYRITTQVTPDDGSEEREPNNAADRATPLAFGRAVRGTIYPRRDIDLFALDLRDRQVKTPLAAQLLGVLKVDVGLYLHRVEADGKLTLVQTSDSAKGDKPEAIRYSAEPGLYVFEVRDVKNRESNFQDSYQLTVDEGD